MSLIEQMKAQAKKAQDEQHTQRTLSADALALRNAKLKEIFNYWREFADLIKVLQPDLNHPVVVPGVGEMTGLTVAETFADYRHVLLGNQSFSEEIDHVSLFFNYTAPQTFQFKKELGIASRVQDVLNRHHILHTADDIKNVHNRVVEVGFTIPWTIKGNIVVKALPESQTLHFALKNVLKLGEIDFEIPLVDVSSAFLDELAKLILGQENQFWKLIKL